MVFCNMSTSTTTMLNIIPIDLQNSLAIVRDSSRGTQKVGHRPVEKRRKTHRLEGCSRAWLALLHPVSSIEI